MIVQKFPKVYAQIQGRTNVILLGDSPNDVQMIDGFPYKNLLKI
jgi:hydroxymethylpyrimidine pyrophosphatase-like HAD family hydrolase